MDEHGEARDSVRVREFVVEQNYAGWRLDQYLTQKIGRLTRSQLGRVVRAGGVTVAGDDGAARKVKPGLWVRPGDRVIVRQAMRAEALQDAEVEVLLMTDDLIFLSKPTGMLVHATATAFQNTVTGYVERRAALDPTWRGAEPIHRLDRETSGVLLLGRSPTACRRLSAGFERGQMRKLYVAVVEDPQARYVPGQAGQTDQPLGFDTASSLPNLKVGAGTWPALTRWRCLSRSLTQPDLAALLIRIEGGRQHQIRAHMALLGTPVAGDKLYGHGDAFYKDYLEGTADLTRLRAPRQALHAWHLSFTDPQAGTPRAATAPLPPLLHDLMGGPPLTPPDDDTL